MTSITRSHFYVIPWDLPTFLLLPHFSQSRLFNSSKTVFLLKYKTLLINDFDNSKSFLCNSVGFAGLPAHVFDYSSIRPHGSLNGYTPMEVYAQKVISMDFSEQTRLARTQRIALNKVQGCTTCN